MSERGGAGVQARLVEMRELEVRWCVSVGWLYSLSWCRWDCPSVCSGLAGRRGGRFCRSFANISLRRFVMMRNAKMRPSFVSFPSLFPERIRNVLDNCPPRPTLPSHVYRRHKFAPCPVAFPLSPLHLVSLIALPRWHRVLVRIARAARRGHSPLWQSTRKPAVTPQ